MNIHPLLFALIVLAGALSFEAVRSLIGSEAERRSVQTRKRLRSLAGPVREDDSEENSLLLMQESGAAGIAKLVAQMPFYDELLLQIYRSGLTMSVRRFLGISLAMALAGALVAFAFLAIPFGEGVGACLGFLPFMNLRRLARKRVYAFELQFPDALDLLIRALKAGHSFSVGLQMVGEELPEPVGREFAIVADEIQLGLDPRKALANLVRRVNSGDLPFFVVAVSLQQETGSNLAEVLGNLAAVIRDRFKLYGKVSALTSMGRASANILAIWPAIMLGSLYTVNPDYIRPLWETDSGHTMMIAASIMVVFGYVICRRMATIEV
jgi:tight adherence protein B